MTDNSRAVTITLWALIGIVLVSFFLPAESDVRSWLQLGGFATMGVLFASGRTTMSRRPAIAFGVYMLIAGLWSGGSGAFGHVPAWWGTAMVLLLTMGAVGFAVVTIRDRRRAGSQV